MTTIDVFPPNMAYSLFDKALFNKSGDENPPAQSDSFGVGMLPSNGYLKNPAAAPRPYDAAVACAPAGQPFLEPLAPADGVEVRKNAYKVSQMSLTSKDSTAGISSPPSSRASSVCSTPRHNGGGLGSLAQAHQPNGFVTASSAPSMSSASSPQSAPSARHLPTSLDAAAAGAVGSPREVDSVTGFFRNLNLGQLLTPFTSNRGLQGSGDMQANSSNLQQQQQQQQQGLQAPAPRPEQHQQHFYAASQAQMDHSGPVVASEQPMAQSNAQYHRGGASDIGSSRTPSPPSAGNPAGTINGTTNTGMFARRPRLPPGIPTGGAQAANGGSNGATPLPSRTPSPHSSASAAAATAAAAAASASVRFPEDRDPALAHESEVLANWVEDMVARSGGVASLGRLEAALSLSNARAYQVLCVRYTGLREFLSRHPQRFVFGVAESSRELVVVLTSAVGSVGPGITFNGMERSGSFQRRQLQQQQQQQQQQMARQGNSGGGGGSPPGAMNGSDPARMRSPPVPSAPGAAGRPDPHQRSWNDAASDRGMPPGANGHHREQQGMNVRREHGGGALAMGGGSALEEKVAIESAEILKDAATRSLKAVELANTLRARLGTEVLALVREQHGGLLTLLERHPHLFHVDRIPKSDCVTLVGQPPFGNRSSSSGSLSGGGADAYAHDQRAKQMGAGGGGGGAAAYRGLLGGGSEEVGPEGATRCLHIGNVPTSMSEDELQRCFERYGRVEGLRVVMQRGHRFAFVNYCTIEDAIQAKACLSRQNVWRSAVSFARRESFRPLRCESFESIGSGGYASDHSCSSSDGRAALAAAAAATSVSFATLSTAGAASMVGARQPVAAAPGGGGGWGGGSSGGGSPPHAQQFAQQQHTHQQQPQQQQPPVAYGSSWQPPGLGGPPPQSSRDLGAGGQGVQQQLQQSMTSQSAAGSGSVSSGASASSGWQPQQQQAQQQQPATGSGGFGSQEFSAESQVLATLTSDQFVPTQAWPTNFSQDWPYVEAVVEQLRHVGGSTTVSKLRGLLKSRLGSARTVKSVPLKALLLAYGPLFLLHGNRVSLMSTVVGQMPQMGPPPQQQQQQQQAFGAPQPSQQQQLQSQAQGMPFGGINGL